MEKNKVEIVEKMKHFSARKDCVNKEQFLANNLEKLKILCEGQKKQLWDQNKSLVSQGESLKGKVDHCDLEMCKELIETLPSRDETQKL